MFPKFFSVIQGVKDDFVLSSHSLTISSTMALKHVLVICLSKRVERYCDAVPAGTASQTIAAGKMNKPVPAKFIEILIPRQNDRGKAA